MKLPEIIAELERIDAEADRERPGARSIEILQSDPPLKEVTLFGNREGLIYLGLLCLDLAENGETGSHYHFDRNSIFRRVDLAVVLARSPGSSPASPMPTGMPD